jgi:hypothetical protein
VQNLTTTQRLFILAALYFLLSGGSIPGIPGGGTVKAVTYVHDRETPVPSGVRAFLNELNHRTPPIMATVYEVETTTPAQYVVAHEAAKSVGLPAIVSTDGKKALKTVRAPQTKEEAQRCLP